jgi:hypothetical protein
MTRCHLACLDPPEVNLVGAVGQQIDRYRTYRTPIEVGTALQYVLELPCLRLTEDDSPLGVRMVVVGVLQEDLMGIRVCLPTRRSGPASRPQVPVLRWPTTINVSRLPASRSAGRNSGVTPLELALANVFLLAAIAS